MRQQKSHGQGAISALTLLVSPVKLFLVFAGSRGGALSERTYLFLSEA